MKLFLADRYNKPYEESNRLARDRFEFEAGMEDARRGQVTQSPSPGARMNNVEPEGEPDIQMLRTTGGAGNAGRGSYGGFMAQAAGQGQPMSVADLVRTPQAAPDQRINAMPGGPTPGVEALTPRAQPAGQFVKGVGDVANEQPAEPSYYDRGVKAEQGKQQGRQKWAKTSQYLHSFAALHDKREGIKQDLAELEQERAAYQRQEQQTPGVFTPALQADFDRKAMALTRAYNQLGAKYDNYTKEILELAKGPDGQVNPTLERMLKMFMDSSSNEADRAGIQEGLKEQMEAGGGGGFRAGSASSGRSSRGPGNSGGRRPSNR